MTDEKTANMTDSKTDDMTNERIDEMRGGKTDEMIDGKTDGTTDGKTEVAWRRRLSSNGEYKTILFLFKSKCKIPAGFHF